MANSVQSFDSSAQKHELPDGLGDASIVELGGIKITRLALSLDYGGPRTRMKLLVGIRSCQAARVGVVVLPLKAAFDSSPMTEPPCPV
jgi:hypothetical protein